MKSARAKLNLILSQVHGLWTYFRLCASSRAVSTALKKAVMTRKPIDIKQVKVCDFASDVPVARITDGLAYVDLAKCGSTLNGKTIKLQLSSIVILYPPRDSQAEHKSAEADLNIIRPDTPNAVANDTSASAGSEDLTVRNLKLWFSTSPFNVPHSPSDRQEAFSVDMTVVDSNQ